MARKWRDVREQARRSRQFTDDQLTAARRETEATVQAYRLAEVRKSKAMSQVALAEKMDISQTRVSRIERGDISRTEVGTLVSYVTGLGGRLRVVAEFDDGTIEVTQS